MAALAVLVAAAPAPAANKGRVASARVIECVKGPTTQGRYATFRGAMRKVAHTDRMWMRFVLEERVGRARYKRVSAPGLGVWRRSRRGVRGLSVKQRVLELAQGASYRTLVQFRWLNANGTVIRRSKRRSGACRQPGVLPNLRVRGVTGTHIGPDKVRYAVQVVNRGAGPASAFGVQLTVDGAAAGVRTIASLAPGETRKVSFTGPSCTGGIQAEADPTDSVRESDELDNSRALACPARR